MTKDEAVELAQGLLSVAGQAYEAEFSLETALLYQFGPVKKEMIMDKIRTEKLDWQNNAILTKWLNDWADRLMKLPVITLTLAFVPKAETLNKISDWINLNTGKEIVLEIKVDRSIVGGALIDFAGRHSDGSIREKFVEAAYGS